MKIAAAVLVLLAVCGCAVSDEDIRKAKNACAPFGGLAMLHTDLSVECNDGTYIKTMGEATRKMNRSAELTDREVVK